MSALLNRKSEPEVEILDHASILRLINEQSFSARKSATDKPAEVFEKRSFSKHDQIASALADSLLPDEDDLPQLIASTAAVAPTPEPLVEPVPEEPVSVTHSLTPEELDDIRRAAFEEGRAKGIEEGRIQGHEEGIEEGRQAAFIELQQAREIFEKAARELTAPAEQSLAHLNVAISEAVRRLAGQRAGRAIDDMPDSFVTRIEMLCDRIAQGMRQVTVVLHPDDLSAIRPHVDGSPLLADSRLLADPKLARGDVAIQAGSIRLNDVLCAAKTVAQ